MEFAPARGRDVGESTSLIDSPTLPIGFDASILEDLEQVEATHFWFVARRRLIAWAVNTYFLGHRRYLEIGSGTGDLLATVAECLPRADLMASDVFEEGLERVRVRVPRCRTSLHDARRLPWVEQFDLAGAYDVLEHIDQDAEALAGIARALVPGGGLLLTVPQHPFLWSGHDEYLHHVRRYTWRAARALVERAGFEVLRITGFVALLFPALIVSRLATGSRRLDRQGFRRSLCAGAATNAACNAIMRLEQSTLRAGLNYPFGGSLLVVAKKKRLFRKSSGSIVSVNRAYPE